MTSPGVLDFARIERTVYCQEHIPSYIRSSGIPQACESRGDRLRPEKNFRVWFVMSWGMSGSSKTEMTLAARRPGLTHVSLLTIVY